MPEARESPSSPLSDEEVMALYAERRLAGMKGSDARLYRRYRRLSPRTRMVVTRAAIYGTIWLAVIGAGDIVTGHNQFSTVPLVGWVIGIALASMVATRVPIHYY